MRDRLVFLALIVLDKTVEQWREQIVKPSNSLRLALAYLCLVSDRKNCLAFDGTELRIRGSWLNGVVLPLRSRDGYYRASPAIPTGEALYVLLIKNDLISSPGRVAQSLQSVGDCRGSVFR